MSNNYALNFNIPMPLHMIFRAGSLIANMLMGIVMLGKRYTTTKYMSVLMITAGIGICTFMSAKTPQASESAEGDLFWLSVGVFLLTFALMLSARMGIYQEVILKIYTFLLKVHFTFYLKSKVLTNFPKTLKIFRTVN